MTLPSPSGPGSKKRVRMRDVATRCDVSISTVSLVLSGDPRIPEDTARKVLATVKAMEYRPSVLARSLARRASRNIGVILPESAFARNKAFYYEALQGIHSQTQPAGYKMVVEAANRAFLSRRYYLRMLREQSADGMIYLAASAGDVFLSEMEKESYPFVLLGSYADDVNVPCVRSDDELGAKMAVQHLLKLGHKKIGYVGMSSEISNGRDREQGYRKTMREAGIGLDEAWIVSGHFDLKGAELAGRSVLEKGVTALFAGNDALAYGVLRAARALGKRVPEDIAVVGMDDLDMSEWMNPTLTTVRYDIRKMAETAARYIIRKVQAPLAQRINLEEMPTPELIVRESCGGK